MREDVLERLVPVRQGPVETRWARRQGNEANKFREQLIRLYGIEVGNKVKFAEAFEICEYGSRPTTQQLKELFPFFPDEQ